MFQTELVQLYGDQLVDQATPLVRVGELQLAVLLVALVVTAALLGVGDGVATVAVDGLAVGASDGLLS